MRRMNGWPKKSRAKLFLGLTLVCLAGLLAFRFKNQASSSPSRITYYQLGTSGPSFNIENSNLGTNAFYLQHLIGTLVRDKAEGRSQPYLAESWDVLDNGKTWKFNIRSGLKCEDGEKIESEQIRQSLMRTLRRFHKDMGGDVPVFSKLKGWKDFPATDLASISAEGQSVVLHFDDQITDGVLEFLAMPNFGHICSANVDADGNWRDNNHIVSSGPYSLAKWDGKSAIELIARNGWPLLEAGAAQHITVVRTLPDLENVHAEPTIVDYQDDYPFDKGRYTLVRSTPTWLFAFVLLPTGTGAFKSKANRIAFLNKVRELQSKEPFDSPRFLNSTHFYPAQATPIVQPHPTPNTHTIRKQVTIVSYHDNVGHQTYLEKLLTTALDELGVKWRMVRVKRSSHTFLKDLMYGDWDIRMQGVSIGGGIENWGNKMMFCSALGAHLADPSGKICQLAKDFDRKQISYQAYVERFNRSLYEDAATIPILHGMATWLFTNHFDLSSVPPNSQLMSLEHLRFRP
jgi:ABC-type oligopeptide transport system substrate-binding subunit